MSNPYQSPQTEDLSLPDSEDKAKLVRVARYQRYVLFALLANIGANIFAFAMMQAGMAVQIVVLLITLAVLAFAITSIFLLAKEVYNIAVGILCGIFMFAPCISLLILLMVNQKATSYLQARGIKVGFMGVNPKNL